MQEYERTRLESRELAMRMRNGTGAMGILKAENAPTHHMDALEQFQKDFAAYDFGRRSQQRRKRQAEIDRKRVAMLQREENRWQEEERRRVKTEQRLEDSVNSQRQGRKRTANSHGLPYNPITLQYDNNAEGERLRRMDEDHRIRGLVRAHNMETHGNCKYDPVNGRARAGIEQVVPGDLRERYRARKDQHYEHLRVQLPESVWMQRQPPRTGQQ